MELRINRVRINRSRPVPVIIKMQNEHGFSRYLPLAGR